ncbi:MAG: SDR family oxidoreductase [Ideonella sp.]|nr:SDR family oxidoreductase [Ideonella sp.]
MKLEGKVALVVGASEAIGRDIAITFAEEGARTAICSRPRPQEPEVVGQLRERGLEAMWAPADMMDHASLKAAVAKVVERYGRLDILAASGSPPAGDSGLFEALDPALYQRKIDAQLLSRMNCLHAALDPMIAQHYGKVIFITTDAGRTPTPGLSVSGAAAAGLMYFTRAAGKELARHGIRINTLPITLTAETPGYEEIMKQGLDNPLTKAYRKIEAKTPFRLTVPADIAKTAVFLASPDSDQISGAVISINGGLAFP